MRFSPAVALRLAAAVASMSLLPAAANANTVVVFGNKPEVGPVELNPTSILIAVSPFKETHAKFRIRQFDYHGPFTGKLVCGIELLNPPKLDIDGDVGIITVPKQGLSLDVGCSAIVLGDRHKYAVEPVEIQIGL